MAATAADRTGYDSYYHVQLRDASGSPAATTGSQSVMARLAAETIEVPLPELTTDVDWAGRQMTGTGPAASRYTVIVPPLGCVNPFDVLDTGTGMNILMGMTDEAGRFDMYLFIAGSPVPPGTGFEIAFITPNDHRFHRTIYRSLGQIFVRTPRVTGLTTALLARDDCDLRGITTVSGEADRRAMLASTLCWVAGQAIPIVPGAEAPLEVPQTQPHAPQAAALLRWPHQDRFPRVTAVDFMRRTIRERPGEVVLVAVGPLTNVALLFDTDPEIPSLLRGIGVMGGVFSDEHRALETWERNIGADPHAAAGVYGAPVATNRSVGLDVTRRVRMSAAPHEVAVEVDAARFFAGFWSVLG